MTEVFVEYKPVVELRLGLVDSNGKDCVAIACNRARLMALGLRDNLWYGFIIAESGDEVIRPGDAQVLTISFLDHLGARSAFPKGSIALFGDGLRSIGCFSVMAEV